MVAHGTATQDSAQRALRALTRALSVLDSVQSDLWREQGLTATQLRVLSRLRRAGSASVGEIAESLQVTPSTATGLVERLVQRRVVRRRPRSGDRRVVDVSLTEAGKRAVDRLVQAEIDRLTPALASIPPGEIDTLARMLDGLAAELEGAAGGPAPVGR